MTRNTVPLLAENLKKGRSIAVDVTSTSGLMKEGCAAMGIGCILRRHFAITSCAMNVGIAAIPANVEYDLATQTISTVWTL